MAQPLDFLPIPLYHSRPVPCDGPETQQTGPQKAGLTNHRRKEPKLADFVMGTRAARANVHPLSLALINQSHLLNIGFPLPVGRFFRVTHIVTELWPFTANITFRHRTTSLLLVVAARQRAQ